MKNRYIIFTTIVLATLAIARVAQARQQSEDRGNGNSAAEGVDALSLGTMGSNNTAHGWFSLFSNTTGAWNTADGFQALYNNTAGSFNLANGNQALYSNTTGGSNVATGFWALYSNTDGGTNTAIGSAALFYNTTGHGNTALGWNAGELVSSASNVICIGSVGANVSNSCFIGHIRGAQTANADALPVIIDSAGQLGTVNSSRRFKRDIKPMEKVSESILALKPVTFRYKSDKTNRPEFGLIAEEVAETNPDLVVRDENREIYTVRYDAINAMLLNEFLKEHRRVEQQERRIEEQDRTIAQLRKEMQSVVAHAKEQDSKIQRVSAQLAAASPSRGELEMSKATPNVVLNNP